MSEANTALETSLRKNTLLRLFHYVQSAESFYVIGGASMGKTRLLDLISKPEVQSHYLGERSNQVWLIRVDMNRLSVRDEPWAFYELLLSSIVLELNNHPEKDTLWRELVELDSQVIQSQELLLALRFFEMAVNRLCKGIGLKLCFLLDEFDEAYQTMPRETFAQLRAVRDGNKSYVSYAIFLRRLPEQLRPKHDIESFYELLSRNMIGVGPYTQEETLAIIQTLETRRDHRLTPVQREQLFEASGGHIGLVQAHLSSLIESEEAERMMSSPGWLAWLASQPESVEECRKIYDGLTAEEQEGLKAFARRDFVRISPQIAKLLIAKGLIRGKSPDAGFFCEIFKQYVTSLA